MKTALSTMWASMLRLRCDRNISGHFGMGKAHMCSHHCALEATCTSKFMLWTKCHIYGCSSSSMTFCDMRCKQIGDVNFCCDCVYSHHHSAIYTAVPALRAPKKEKKKEKTPLTQCLPTAQKWNKVTHTGSALLTTMCCAPCDGSLLCPACTLSLGPTHSVLKSQWN